MDMFEIHEFFLFPYIILPVIIYIVIDFAMPGKWQKQKVKDFRIDLERFNRCLSTSDLRNPLSFNCHKRQNITLKYF